MSYKYLGVVLRTRAEGIEWLPTMLGDRNSGKSAGILELTIDRLLSRGLTIGENTTPTVEVLIRWREPSVGHAVLQKQNGTKSVK